MHACAFPSAPAAQNTRIWSQSINRTSVRPSLSLVLIYDQGGDYKRASVNSASCGATNALMCGTPPFPPQPRRDVPARAEWADEVARVLGLESFIHAFIQMRVAVALQ